MGHHPTTVTRIGVPSSQTTVKPFVFSKVELTGTWHASKFEKRISLERDLADDDNFLAMPSGIGEIKIVISEISATLSTKPASYKVARLSQTVHERSKKGIVHGVRLVSVLYASPTLLTCKGCSLANDVQRPKGTEGYGSYTKTLLRDLVTFVFKYRPLGGCCSPCSIQNIFHWHLPHQTYCRRMILRLFLLQESPS